MVFFLVLACYYFFFMVLCIGGGPPPLPIEFSTRQIVANLVDDKNALSPHIDYFHFRKKSFLMFLMSNDFFSAST